MVSKYNKPIRYAERFIVYYIHTYYWLVSFEII